MALEEKFRDKYHHIPSKMGFLNRAYSCVLPTIAIAESIFLIIIVLVFLFVELYRTLKSTGRRK